MNLRRRLHKRWHEPAGLRELMLVAFPLVISQGSLAIQFFAERVVLTWDDPETMAAALPAAITAFTLLTGFVGMAGYTSVFVAQFIGAGRRERLGQSLAAGLAVAVLALVLHLCLMGLAEPLFHWIGHDPTLVPLEGEYLRILCLRAGPATANAAIAGYFAGQHRTLPVMTVNLIMIAVATALFYPMIIGVGDWPGFGLAGGAWAEVVTQCVGLLIYGSLLLRPSERVHLGIGRVPLIDVALMRRMFRFGGPRGLQVCAEILGFTIFVLLLGRLGAVELAATSVAFDINALVFMPMLGLSTGVSALVGQRLGRRQPALVVRSVRQSLALAYVFVGLMIVLYLATPRLFLLPFALLGDHAEWNEIAELVVVLMRFIAIYALFDATYIILTSALAGAGDTSFPMRAMVPTSIVVLVLPTWIGLIYFGAGLFTAWVFLALYIITLTCIIVLRYHSGAWRKMRVIEDEPVVPAVAL